MNPSDEILGCAIQEMREKIERSIRNSILNAETFDYQVVWFRRIPPLSYDVIYPGYVEHVRDE